ncbi:hypothetical protein VitviT2T_023199 [Vitis vinifera]|uniref:Uncharacterized protein n=1 Tax=Vitis vinifera TaxID=29760 RepID=A0ABY9DF47_VITVI|nr:hypothetical protein VitviT2T_023199 [Vitis vinifera]
MQSREENCEISGPDSEVGVDKETEPITKAQNQRSKFQVAVDDKDEAAWKFIQCIDAHVTAERHMPDFQESRGCQEMGKKHEQGEITTRDHREARCYYCFGYPSSCMSSDSNYSSTSASISDNGRYC